MQKGTVADARVMHRTNEAPDRDCGKPLAADTASTPENTHPNPARNHKRENGHPSIASSPTEWRSDEDGCPRACTPHPEPGADLCSSIRPVGGVAPKRMGAFLTRVLTAAIAAVMTVSLGALAADALDAHGALGAGGQSAYASTGTTPYTNIDVPLSGHSGGNHDAATNNSDNANPDRVQADGAFGDSESQGTEGAGILGPYPPSASGRTSEGGGNAPSDGGDTHSEGDPEDDSEVTSNGLTYTRNKDANGEYDGTYTLTHADPKIGKVATLPSNVTAIAEGAFTDCTGLETIIVFGTVNSIAKSERDLFGNITRQGAFTDEQLKSVHVVFALNVLEDHDHGHGDGSGDGADATDGADAVDGADADGDADNAAGNDANASDGAEGDAADNAADEADESDTPVDQGIKRLSGDVRLSTPASKSSPFNQWAQTGFKNIAAGPEAGSKSTDTQGDAGAQGGFIYTLLPDYTLEVAWDGDSDMPLDLAIPDYGRVEGTTYEVSRIASNAFKGSAVEVLMIPENVVAIGDSAFEGCADLKEVALPDTLTTIGDRAFQATGIATLEIPNTVMSIGEYTFANCPNLARVTSKEVKDKFADETAENNGSGDAGSGQASTESGTADNEDALANEADKPDTNPDDENADAATADPGSALDLTSEANTNIKSTAFEGTSAQVDEEIYRTTYNGIGWTEKGEFNYIEIYLNGGTWYTWDNDVYEGSGYTGGYMSSRQDVASGAFTLFDDNNKKKDITAWWGDGGSAHFDFNDGDNRYQNNWMSCMREEGSAKVDGYWCQLKAYRTGYRYDGMNARTNSGSWVNLKTVLNEGGDSYGAIWNGLYECDSCDRWIYFPDGGRGLQFRWVANTYTVKYNSNKPSGTLGNVAGSTSNSSHTYDTAKALTSNGYSLNGWTFTGWNTKADGTGTSYSNGASVKNLTSTNGGTVNLYAQWTPNTYTVTYNSNKPSGAPGSVSGSTADSTHTYDTQKNLTANGYSLTGYTFTGWNKKADGTGLPYSDKENVINLTSTHCGTVTLYAQWKIKTYTITLSAPNATGTNPASCGAHTEWKRSTDGKTLTRECDFGTTITYLPSATRSAYTFAGWTTSDQTSSTTKSNSITSIYVDGDKSYYAYWYFTASYNGNGSTSGTVPDTITYYTGSYGQVSHEVSDKKLERTNYKMLGWLDYNATVTTTQPSYVSGNIVTIKGSVVFYACWYFTVSYHAENKTGGYTPMVETYYTGLSGVVDHAVSAADIKRTNYNFVGWTLSDIAYSTTAPQLFLTDSSHTSVLSVSGNTDLYACWSFAVSYYAYEKTGGTIPASTTYYTGSSGTAQHTVSTATLTRTNYSWYGWVDSNITWTTLSPTIQTGVKTVTGNKAYYAAWSFTVSYSGNGYTGGTIPASSTYYTGSSGAAQHTVSTAALIRTNYSWYGWLDSNISGTSTAPTRQTGSKTVYGNTTFYAAWSFTVRYSAANRTTGDVPGPYTYYTGSSGTATHAVSTNAFTRTHYDWYGWSYTDITGSTTAPTAYAANSSITVSPNDDTNKCRWLYAAWKFYVGYSGNNDAVSGTVPSDATLYAGSAGSAAYTTQNPSLTQRGYVFGRNSGHAAEDAYTNTLTVAYPNKWNTRADGSGTWYTGSQATTLAPTTTNTDASGKKVVLHGQWTLIRYDITYSLNDGKAENPTTYTVRDASFTLNKPTRPGYDFSPGRDALGQFTIGTCGWTGNYDADAKEGKTGYSMPRTDTLTIHQGSIGQIALTANWHLHEYAISYSLNGGALPSLQANPSTYNVETATFTLVNPEKYPYSFKGWTVTGADTENGSAIDTQGVQTRILKGTIGTLSCTAAWESFSYNISYDGNGETGGSTASTAAEYGQPWTAAANGFTKEGFDFDSWNTQANGRGQRFEPGKTYADNLVSERGTNATLYAIWKANPYTVRFNPNFDGAAADPYTQDMYCGEPRDLTPNRFSRTGYVFAGWSEIPGIQPVKYADGQRVVDLETVAGRTHELYAQWTPIAYTVNFHANNTDATGATNPQTLTYDVPEALHGCGYIVQGHRFTGWNTSSAGTGEAYDDYQMVKNLTTRTDIPVNLYAQWAPIEYTVTYVKNDANVEGADSQTSEHAWGSWKALTSIEDLGWTWTGHHFTGWYLSGNGTGISYRDAESVRNLTERHGDNVQLYAQWAPDVHRVTLDTRGGTYVQGATHDPRWTPISGGASAQRDIEYGDVYASDLGLPTFERPGYNFAGWWTVAEPTEENPGTQVAAGDQHVFLELADQTLYARWTPIKYSYRLAVETAEGGTRYLSDIVEVDFEDEIYMPTRDDEVGLGEKMPLKKFAKQGYLIVGWSLSRTSTTADFAFGSYQSGLTTEEGGDPVVIWAIQTLGDYYAAYYKDESQTELFFIESIRKGHDYELTSARIERPGYTQTHWEIPSAGHIQYPPGTHIQTNNILTGQFEVGDEVAIIPVFQKVQFEVQFYDEIGSKKPEAFSQAYEDRVSRLNKNQFSTAEGDYTFEGYWTEPSGGGVMLYDANGRPAGPNANEDGVWRYAPESGLSRLVLYAKWTCPVTFEFPYGGGTRATHSFIVYTSYADIANAKNFEFLGEDEWGNLVDANYVDTSWYADWIKALFNPTHATDPAHAWAGWYNKPELGRVVPTSREVEEPTTLYGCWKVYANFNYWDDPAYSSGWTLRGNALEQVADGDGNLLPGIYRQQLVQGQTYQTSGLLPTAARAGYTTEADCWNDDPEGRLVFRTPGTAPVYNADYRISKDDVMRHSDDFDVYLEYALGRANVRIERYLEDIGGIDYSYVEGADGMDTLGTESLIDDAPYRDDAPSSDYLGFTYDSFTVESTKDGVRNTDGRVAGDGTTVVHLYYSRHTFDLTLEDFWVKDEAGDESVRGAGASQGTYPREDIDVEYAESGSYGRLSGIETGAAKTMEVWYGQTVELDAAADAGYAFDRWQVTDGADASFVRMSDGGTSALAGDAVETKVKDASASSSDDGDADADPSTDADEGADPSASADADEGPGSGLSARSDIPTYTFVVRDSAPFALATFKAVDVPYSVEAYFEGLDDASTSSGTFTRDYSNARGADMSGLLAKTDSMTRVVEPGQPAQEGRVALADVPGFKVAYIESGTGSSDAEHGVTPERLLDSTDAKASAAEDRAGYENAAPWIENAIVKGDGSTVVRAFYKRCAHTFEVAGSEWADATGASGTAPARLALFDDSKHSYMAAISEDTGNAPGKSTYAAFYEADVSVAARAAGHAELTGYTSDKDGIAGGDHGEVYGFDSEDLLDRTLPVPEDTDGLPQWDDPRYEGSMYGFSAKAMPAADVSVTVQAQPMRATYISRYLFQDTDPTSETDPASTYTLNRSEEMASDTSYEIEVTRTADNSRLLRYYIDGTDAQNHRLDGTDSSADASQRGDLAVPPVGFEPSGAADAVTSLAQLTPEGNEDVDGERANVAYSKYDRKRHGVAYTYSGGPNEAENQRPDGVDAPEAVSSYYGATVRIADTPSVSGWGFDGWMWQADPDNDRDGFPHVGQGTDSPSVSVPDFDVAITGTWSALPYTLTYDGGTAEATPSNPMTPTGASFGETTVLFNSEWQVTDTVPTRPGYTFLGWTFAERALFEALAGSAADLVTDDVDQYKASLASLSDFDGNPLLLTPSQTQVWSWHKGDRTLHAIWMRDSYDVTFDLADGGWPTGTTVPLSYMTGDEVKIPQPEREGYTFTGWEVTCGGSPLDGDAPAVSYADGDPTRAVINGWAYGNIAFTARYEVRRFTVDLNGAGGRFDGTPEDFMGEGIDYASPDGEGSYGQASVHVPYGTEITSTTPLPEPTRPGYDFAGWTDAEGKPIGWTLDDEGDRVDAPYTFDDAADVTWVATWRPHRYQITYDLGEYADSVTIRNIGAFSEYFAGMTDGDGNTVTSFMLPTADDLTGLPDGVGFDGWYPAGGNPDSDRMRSFDPNTETGDKAFVAIFSTGANVYTERFWLEVLDQAEDDPGRQYASIGGTRFALDEALTVTRRTDAHNAIASMSAISGFTPVDPYECEYPADQPYMCIFSSGQDTVNGFYTRKAHTLTVGTATGIDGAETLIEVSPASALVKGADTGGGAYAADADANTATLKGEPRATVKWGAQVSVGVSCPRTSGYAFVSWQTDAGKTPADIDVRANPARFTMPDADVALDPSTGLVRFKATYRDAFGKDVAGAGRETFTVEDAFALKNLDDMAGYTFAGWEAYVADQDGNRLDPEANPVPGTVGYDDAHGYMRVRQGTASDLLFEARYTAIGYTVSVALPKGTAYLPSGMPDGLPQIDGVEWVLMPGDGGTDAIGFEYTVEDLSEPLVIDLSGISCAPYRVDSWSVAGQNGESGMPDLTDGVLTLTKDDLGNWDLTPDVSPIRYTLTLDLSDVRDGYVPLDPEEVKAGLEAAGYAVEDGDGPGTLDVTFDVDSADPYTLPSFGKADPDSSPEFAFRGWAKDGDGANASNPCILPPSDIASWPESGTVIKPVWAKAGEQSTLIAHLPNDEGDYTDDYAFTFTGDALTPIDYAQDERFSSIVNDVDDINVGYHLVWHGSSGLTEDDVTTLPANFPASGTVEVWGEWVEDDDIITVGFGVKWDNSAPPGEVKPRSAFALRSADMAAGPSDAAAYPDDADSGAAAFSARSTYEGDATAAGDAAEAPVADANSTYYYIPGKGLYTKDANGRYHVVTRIENINEISGAYAGWRLEGFYLPIDTSDPKRIIIGPDGEVDNATLMEVAGAKPSDLTFTVRWARISLVEINMAGGYGDASEDLTLFYWPEKDVFVKGDDAAIGDEYSAPRGYARDDFNTSVMLGAFAARGIPATKEDADGTHAFLGYFGEISRYRWDFAKDEGGGPLPAVNALALTPAFSYLAVQDDYKKQVTLGQGTIDMPYGYKEAAGADGTQATSAYDPAAKDGTTGVVWRAAWEGDLDAVYFNATVPMSMSFMIRADGAVFGPDAGAYRIRNYSNCAITVEDMSFAWSEDGLASLFGEGGTGAITLTAKPTEGQAYSNAVTLSKQDAEEGAGDDGSTELVSRYVFADDGKWVIAKSVGIDPDSLDPERDKEMIASLPTLRLDYALSTGGVKPITFQDGQTDTAHAIGTLKFTLKTAR